ncbi:unnamed protein product, partial [Laminaria digitata]
MSMNENELLELNADLMVLIREKQEQGALADAVSLQIVLHKNLMRLRLFMNEPDEPIPDAPKDWLPPVARSYTPPPGATASGDATEGEDTQGGEEEEEEAGLPQKGKPGVSEEAQQQ